MNGTATSLMSIPAPCGLMISSVTSDNQYLYALQPDRRTVYKLDVCGRIICVFRLSRRYESIVHCGNGRFFATARGERFRIYILNKCFNETGFIEPDISSNNGTTCSGGCTAIQGNTLNSCLNAANQLFIGPSGDCCDTNSCMLAVANLNNSYIVTSGGRVISRLGSAGRNLIYTAIAENNDILYEGLESTLSSQTFVRATVLSSGSSKVQRLPFGYRVRSFFCHDGRLYAFITKNSFHGYVAAICTFLCNGVLCGDIIGLPDSPFDSSCCEESCNFGNCSSCRCGGTSCDSVSSNQTEMCSNAVSGETEENENCDIDELCRIIGCIKHLCKNFTNSGCGSCAGGCNGNCNCTNGCGGHHTCVNNCSQIMGSGTNNCCCGQTLSCECFPTCDCSPNDTDSETCLPLPPCDFHNPCCKPCKETPCQSCAATGNVKVTYNNRAK